MRIAYFFFSTPLLSLVQLILLFKRDTIAEKSFYSYWYNTIYLLKTGFAKKPKHPV